ncbi:MULTISPECIES: hypothetical protein [unclassified Streptomyces]|uniref:hypothetical protein n=1 Tax=unclassified Streptomyces TaxID=2593676 RepID=UPI0027836E65|nr:hypothetical protein [Streptomyces sp. V1I6]MDQ0845428.1 hypothetical protein [Streptomyces sp. V1I6]
MGRTGTTRRRALLATGAAAAGMLTGCSSDSPGTRRPSGRSADPARAQAALRARLAARSTALGDEYDAVIARHPELAERLTPLRTAVAAHAVALGGGRPGQTSAAPSPSVTPSTAPPVTPSATAAGSVPKDPAAALKALAAAERRTSDSHTDSLADAEPELARLLASVAAAGAAHAYLLTKGDPR